MTVYLPEGTNPLASAPRCPVCRGEGRDTDAPRLCETVTSGWVCTYCKGSGVDVHSRVVKRYLAERST